MMKCVHNERKIVFNIEVCIWITCKLFSLSLLFSSVVYRIIITIERHSIYKFSKEEEKEISKNIVDGWMDAWIGNFHKEASEREGKRERKEENEGNEKWERKASERYKIYQES